MTLVTQLTRSVQAVQIATAARLADSPLRAVRAVDAILESYRMAMNEGNEPCVACGDERWIYADDGDVNAGHGLGGTEPSKMDCPLCVVNLREGR